MEKLSPHIASVSCCSPASPGAAIFPPLPAKSTDKTDKTHFGGPGGGAGPLIDGCRPRPAHTGRHHWLGRARKARTADEIRTLVVELLSEAREGRAWAMRLVVEHAWPVETEATAQPHEAEAPS